MKKNLPMFFGIAALTALLTYPAAAATQTATAGTRQTHHTITNTVPNAWPPESMTGMIAGVDRANRVLIIKDSSGVPFDLVVNRSTRIKSSAGNLRLGDLTSDVGRKAEIRFVPKRAGDIARSIQLGG